MIGRVLVTYFWLPVFCDRQRPFFAGTDTEKFSFRNMVSDKWPATFGNLFAVRRQADKQFSFYRPIDFGVLREERRTSVER